MIDVFWVAGLSLEIKNILKILKNQLTSGNMPVGIFGVYVKYLVIYNVICLL